MMSDFDKKQAIQDNEVDDIVSAIYRRFKEWNKRGFTADDVTWCEVKGDVLSIIDKLYTRPSDVRRLSDDAYEIIKAVAHIGVDFGYGKFELDGNHIAMARKELEIMDDCNIPKEGE